MNPPPQQSDIQIKDDLNIHPQPQHKNNKINPIPSHSPPNYFHQNMIIELSQQIPSHAITVNKNVESQKLAKNKGNKDNIINIQQIPHNDLQQQQSHNLTCWEKFKARKKTYIAIIMGLLILIVVAIILPIILSSQYVDPSPPIIQRLFTEQSTNQCQGVPPDVCSYIFQNYNDHDQILALIQTSRSLSLINLENSCHNTRQRLSDIYTNIFASVQCLALNLPNDFIQVFQKLTKLHFSTQKSVQAYLNMTQSFSGQPLRLLDETTLAKTCRFNMTNARRRLLQQGSQVSDNTTIQTNCSSNTTSVLIYISGIGYSPSAMIKNIFKIKQIISKNSSTNFDAGIIALGARRTDEQLEFFSSLVKSYESYLQSNGQSIPTRYSLYSALKMVLNLCRDNSCLPQQISKDLFINLWGYYVQRSTYSFTNEDTFYQYKRHRNFVVQQILEGKKVVLLAHGQGSVYANKIYELLNDTQKDSVKLVYVAPSVDSMADGSMNYITNPNDTIIQNILSNVWTNTNIQTDTNRSITYPLDGNMPGETFDQQVDFGTNHQLFGYAESYKQQLTFLIIIAKLTAIQPVNQMIYGPIMIRLNWDNQTNIDLHLIQPDGTHVYWFHPKGRNGYLQNYFQTQKTEDYYTNCNISKGNYTVFIHYSNGNNQSTAIITVSAGSQQFVKSLKVTSGFIYDICIVNVEQTF